MVEEEEEALKFDFERAKQAAAESGLVYGKSVGTLTNTHSSDSVEHSE